jgi:TIR domain
MGDTTQARPQRVFISYRRTDTAYPAGWLYESLAERFGDAQVFKDVDSIEPGDDFVAELTRAVSMCDVLLALIGTTWLSTEIGGGRRIDQPDDFVRIEIETALRRNVRVIPVLVDGASMPTTDQVPSSLAASTRRQAVELSGNRFNADVAGLIRAIESTPTTPPPRRPEGARPRSRQPGRAPEGKGKVRPAPVAALACAAAGAALMLLGAGEPLLVDGGSLYSGTSQQDIQHALPSVVLAAAVLLVAWPNVAASWVVGAGITVLALDYASTTLWVGVHAGYEHLDVAVE